MEELRTILSSDEIISTIPLIGGRSRIRNAFTHTIEHVRRALEDIYYQVIEPKHRSDDVIKQNSKNFIIIMMKILNLDNKKESRKGDF